MHNNVSIIEHDPAGLGRPFFTRVAPKLLSNRLINMLDNSAKLAIIVAGADHKIIGDRALRANVQEDNFVRLLIFGQVNNPAGDSCCLYVRAPLLSGNSITNVL